MSVMLGLYRALAPVAANVAPLLGSHMPKLAESLAGRRGVMNRLLAATPSVQGAVWIHASSVGEFLQGIPIIEAIRSELGTSAPPIVCTHFSPSGIAFARKRPCAELHDYLPLDLPRDMDRLVSAWRPRLLIFIKFDVWPSLTLAAHRAGVPVFLMAGSLAPTSDRLRWPARDLYRDVFDLFTHVGVSTEEDHRRFTGDLGVSAPVSVTGDTRVEQVIVRYEESKGGDVSERLCSLGGRLLVLGSTWPPDEQLWLPVLPELLSRFDDVRVVLCPHEPLPERLAELENILTMSGVANVRLSALMQGAGSDARVIVVDSVGVLAEIYRAGHLAYVGGSFTTGVHNTMEPAIALMPVLFGPRIQNAEEAGALVGRKAGFVCTAPAEALEMVTEFLADAALLRRTGKAAREVVLEQRGATERSLAVLRPHLAP